MCPYYLTSATSGRLSISQASLRCRHQASILPVSPSTIFLWQPGHLTG